MEKVLAMQKGGGGHNKFPPFKGLGGGREKFHPVLRGGGGAQKIRTCVFPIL